MKIFIPGIMVTDSCKEAMEDWKVTYPLPVFSTSAEAWAYVIGFCESYEHIYAGVMPVELNMPGEESADGQASAGGH